MKRAHQDFEAKKARDCLKNGQWLGNKNWLTKPLPQAEQQPRTAPDQSRKRPPLSDKDTDTPPPYKNNKRAPPSDDEESDAPRTDDESDSQPFNNDQDMGGQKKGKRSRMNDSQSVDENENLEGSMKGKRKYKVKTEREGEPFSFILYVQDLCYFSEAGEKALFVCKTCFHVNKACVVVVRERVRKDTVCRAC